MDIYPGSKKNSIMYCTYRCEKKLRGSIGAQGL